MDDIRRFIRGMGFPFADDLDFSRHEHIVIVVRWLEDTKVRELAIEERRHLRGDNDKWDDFFASYLTRVGCPFDWSAASQIDCLHWLVSLAVSSSFSDYISDQKQYSEMYSKIIELGVLVGVSIEVEGNFDGRG